MQLLAADLHTDGERIKFLDYIKIEKNDLDGRICLLSGLLSHDRRSAGSHFLQYTYI